MGPLKQKSVLLNIGHLCISGTEIWVIIQKVIVLKNEVVSKKEVRRPHPQMAQHLLGLLILYKTNVDARIQDEISALSKSLLHLSLLSEFHFPQLVHSHLT